LKTCVCKKCRAEAFSIYGQSSSLSADDPASLPTLRLTGSIFLRVLRRTGYLLDADRSTLSLASEALEGRLSTGYSIETYL
jgi:hypothetical protein